MPHPVIQRRRLRRALRTWRAADRTRYLTHAASQLFLLRYGTNRSQTEHVKTTAYLKPGMRLVEFRHALEYIALKTHETRHKGTLLDQIERRSLTPYESFPRKSFAHDNIHLDENLRPRPHQVKAIRCIFGDHDDLVPESSAGTDTASLSTPPPSSGIIVMPCGCEKRLLAFWRCCGRVDPPSFHGSQHGFKAMEERICNVRCS